jgi:prolyl-tRNA synthetase
VVVKDSDGNQGPVTRAAAALVEEMTRRGIRARLDDNVGQGFGRRATDWDLQGVPVRVELGPRDLAEDAALLYRRDTRDKTKVALGQVAEQAQRLTGAIQADMLAAATARRDAAVVDCDTVDQAREAAQTGVARVPWEVLGTDGEEELATHGITVRCLQRSDGSLPETDRDAGTLAYVARAY